MTRFTKVSHLVAASVAALVGSTGAMAAGPAAAPTAAHTFYFAGGSAEPQAVAVATCNLLNNVDSYSTSAVGQVGANYLLLLGTLKATVGTMTSGTTVGIMYKFNGGSLPNGGVPQAGSGEQLVYPSIATAFQVPTGGGPGNYCTPGNGTTTVTDTTALTFNNNQQPSFGLTDLEVTAFSGINNPLTPAALPVVGAASPIYDLVFGIAVTAPLFAQKQNFSYAEIAGILSGAITNWNQLYGDQGAFVNQPLTSGNIILLDRNVGSGHKASSSAEFLGYPALGSVAFLPNSVSNGYSGGADGKGTPPVACTTAYQDIQEGSAGATVSDLKRLDGQAAPAGCGGSPVRAIAILSMDNPPAIAANQVVSGTNSYDFVSLDGTWVDAHTSSDDENGSNSTSYDNVLKGNYHWFYQANFNTLSGFLGNGSDAALLSAQYLAQLSSTSLPGCSGTPGKAFPGNVPGIVNDLFSDTGGTLTACTAVSSRNGNSDSPLFPYQTLGGGIALGQDPL